MALGAEMSLESATCPPRPGQVVLMNLEINNRCNFTTRCGSTCYLNQVAVDRPILSEDRIYDAAQAFFRRGDVIRHAAIPGKEPFESPLLLQRIAEAYHAVPFRERPASLGVISASTAGIRQHLPSFEKSPLCWLAVSVDVAGSGLRIGDPYAVLKAGLRGRDGGGTKALAVNTTFHEKTFEQVLALGNYLRGMELDQWALCGLVGPQGPTMQPMVADDTVSRMIKAAGALVDVAKRVVVETDPATIRRVIGEELWSKLTPHTWRIEALLPSGVWLFARSPHPGYFVRMRYDGALLSRQDFTQIGLLNGHYGKFSSASDIDIALSKMAQERHEAITSCLPAQASKIQFTPAA